MYNSLFQYKAFKSLVFKLSIMIMRVVMSKKMEIMNGINKDT